MWLSVLVGVLIVIVGGIFIFFIQKRFLAREMKAIFTSLSTDIAKNNNEEFLLLAKQSFALEQEKAQGGLDLRRNEISMIVKELEKKLAVYENMVREFEKERSVKYGNIEERMRGSVDATQRLQQTTEKLTAILGNVKLRGKWGERMAEDILRYSGLEENVHYLKDKAQSTVSTRPDFTFLLPDGHKVNMDVKFPLANYLEFQNAKDDNLRKKLLQDFIRDVKTRIKEVQNRDYIKVSEKTLGYMILFIPNEQVYGFIHNAEPQLIDDALQRKVILCSPFTLYAVLSIIRESFDNFYFKRATHDILGVINEFTKTYEVFRNRFNDLGGQIKKTQLIYDDITSKSYKMMDSKVRKVDNLRNGATQNKE